MSKNDSSRLGSLPIDLNLDAGESADALENGQEAALYDLVTSVNIACGGHTGDATTMAKSVALAKERGLRIGAHPSFPDQKNFGRTNMKLPKEELLQSLVSQIRLLSQIASKEGVALQHVKPHGALYNLCAEDEELALVVITAIKSTLPNASAVGLAGSRFLSLAKENGLEAIAEGFVDRRYEANATLRSRNLPGAMIESPSDAAKQAVALAKQQPIQAFDGERIQLSVQTLCIHGDSPNSLEFAKAVRVALENLN